MLKQNFIKPLKYLEKKATLFCMLFKDGTVGDVAASLVPISYNGWVILIYKNLFERDTDASYTLQDKYTLICSNIKNKHL